MTILSQHLANLTREEKITLLEALDAYDEKVRYNKKDYLFPDTGPLRRELYVRHLEFFRATKTFSEVAFIAASRSGKSYAGCYADSCWLTGEYPDWWEGKVFDDPITLWASAVTNQKVKESIQDTLFGKTGDLGTGIIPKRCIDFDSIRYYHGTDVIEDCYIYWRGSKKQRSKLTFKSYKQEVMAYESSDVNVCHSDEEVPEDIYTACLARTATNSGLNILTFTPLHNLTSLVKQFLPGGRFPPGGSGSVDAPHVRV